MKITLQFESFVPTDSQAVFKSRATSDSITQALLKCRDDLFSDEAVATLPGFIKQPEVQLTEYANQREASPLGQIFQVANGLHPHLDAVVVLGCDESISGIRAITDACCDPYHNELSRADRGSKPRLYFAGNHLDNDATSSLLHRLASGGYGNTEAEKRFAIIAVDHPDREAEVVAVLPHFIDRLRTALGERAGDWLPRLVIPIRHRPSQLDPAIDAVKPVSGFENPSDRDPCWGVLSPVGLLPAAFLGLDCMKLLEGAYAITEQFRTADFDDNLVLQYVAAQQLSAPPSMQTHPIKNWNPALNSLQRWHEFLQSKRSPSTAERRQHWSIRSCRTDSIYQKDPVNDSDTGNELSFDQLNEAALRDLIDQSNHSESSAMRLFLPEIDTYGIGQWIQLLMLSECFRKVFSAETPC